MNAFTNGRAYEKMSEEDLNVLSQIKWLSQEDANKILLPYLDKKYQEALDCYTKAIEYDSNNEIFYYNLCNKLILFLIFLLLYSKKWNLPRMNLYRFY